MPEDPVDEVNAPVMAPSAAEAIPQRPEFCFHCAVNVSLLVITLDFTTSP
jgi:hypothetical protein